MNTSYQDSAEAVKSDTFFTFALPPGVKSRAKKQARVKSIFTMKYLSEQIYAMMGTGEKINSYFRYDFDLNHIGIMFSIKDNSHIKKLWKQGKKDHKIYFGGSEDHLHSLKLKISKLFNTYSTVRMPRTL